MQSRNRHLRRAFTLIELIVVAIGGSLLIALPLAFWTDRTLTFWVTHFKDLQSDAEISYGLSYLCSLPWPLTIVVNFVSEIGRAFV